MRLTAEPLSCQELVELVTDYLDGSLSRADRRRFRGHLRKCEHCSEYVEQMRLTIEASGRLTVEDVDPAAREALLEAFGDWKRDRLAGEG